MIFHVAQTIVTTTTGLYEIDADSPTDAVARFNAMTPEQREGQQIDFHETDDVQSVALPDCDTKLQPLKDKKEGTA